MEEMNCWPPMVPVRGQTAKPYRSTTAGQTTGCCLPPPLPCLYLPRRQVETIWTSESPPALPTAIGERCSQTMLNIWLLATMGRCELPYKWTAELSQSALFFNYYSEIRHLQRFSDQRKQKKHQSEIIPAIIYEKFMVTELFLIFRNVAKPNCRQIADEQCRKVPKKECGRVPVKNCKKVSGVVY
jgi:hypothetical protein